MEGERDLVPSQRSSYPLVTPRSIFPVSFFRLGQWGTPIFSIVGSSAMSIGILVSIIESVGNYISCAKISEVRQPPRHAINRGIAMEGVASMFAGMCGSGNGTTSYSENIAAIGVTRVRNFLKKINVNIIKCVSM